MTKKISRLLGTVIILANLGFFIPLTIETLKSGGGGFGYGLLLLPINAITHLLLIPAILTWTDKSDKQYGFLITNSLGTLWLTFWFVLFITAIQPDNNELTETVDNVEKSTLITLTADNHPDKNFSLVEDFEKSKGTFRPDTFELCLVLK